jgi:hypothetical protein
MEIYIHRDGEQFGPYSVEQTRDYMASGNLLPGDLAWHEGATDWVPLANLDGIASPAPSLVSAPEQAVRPAWVPPRRTDAPWSQMVVPRRVPEEAATRKASNVVGGATATLPVNQVQRTSRRRSAPVDGLKRQQRAIGARNMAVGAAICIGGTAITVFTYEAATTGPGGGTYIISWGAILFGGIRFLKGLILFCKA